MARGKSERNPAWRAPVTARRPRGILLLIAMLLAPTSALAADAIPLMLPLAVAIAVSNSVIAAHQGAKVDWTVRVRGGLLSVLPAEVAIPDFYKIDATGRTPPRFAAPADRNRMVGIHLLSDRWHGWMASVNFDTDHIRGGTSSHLGSIVLGIKF